MLSFRKSVRKKLQPRLCWYLPIDEAHSVPNLLLIAPPTPSLLAVPPLTFGNKNPFYRKNVGPRASFTGSETNSLLDADCVIVDAEDQDFQDEGGFNEAVDLDLLVTQLGPQAVLADESAEETETDNEGIIDIAAMEHDRSVNREESANSTME